MCPGRRCGGSGYLGEGQNETKFYLSESVGSQAWFRVICQWGSLTAATSLRQDMGVAQTGIMGLRGWFKPNHVKKREVMSLITYPLTLNHPLAVLSTGVPFRFIPKTMDTSKPPPRYWGLSLAPGLDEVSHLFENLQSQNAALRKEILQRLGPSEVFALGRLRC